MAEPSRRAARQPRERQAILFSVGADGVASCRLCPHRCEIADGERGSCRLRYNRDGVLYTEAYDRLIARNVEPIEKKPLFHFRPGSSTYSLGTCGCNMACPYCINWEVSQVVDEVAEVASEPVSPEEVVAAALGAGCHSLTYTFVEPTIYLELAADIGLHGRRRGLDNVFKTNGFMTPEALDVCGSFLDAANVDLKSLRESTYRHLGASLQPVLDSLVAMKAAGIWIEVTTLVVPGLVEDDGELTDIARFIGHELGRDTPWHLARFLPAFRMTDSPPTPVETMTRAREIGRREGLSFVYIPNLLGPGLQDTSCAGCGRVLLRRRGTQLTENSLEGGACPDCGQRLPGRRTAG